MGLFNHFPYTNLHELNLDWILRVLKQMCGEIDNLQAIAEQLQKELEQLGQNIDEKVQDWLEEQGPEVVQEWIAKWIQTSVWFGLTDDGYWVAYIPDSWSTINFSTTGLDDDVPIQPEYGHLVLKY